MSPEEAARYDEYWVNVAENISNEALDNQISYIKSGGITKPGGGKYQPVKISATVDLNTGDIYFGYNGSNKFNPSRTEIVPELQQRIDYTMNLVKNTEGNIFANKSSFEIWSVNNFKGVKCQQHSYREWNLKKIKSPRMMYMSLST